MARIDYRINLSFKNTEYEVELFKFAKEKGKLMGDSAYIKALIERDKREDEERKKKSQK